MNKDPNDSDAVIPPEVIQNYEAVSSNFPLEKSNEKYAAKILQTIYELEKEKQT